MDAHKDEEEQIPSGQAPNTTPEQATGAPSAAPANEGGDGGGRQDPGAQYAEATRDKVRGSDYAGGQEVMAPAAAGGGYAQTKAAMQPKGESTPDAPLATVPATDVEGKIVELLSYGWTDVVITDAEATEAFRLLSISGDKKQVFQKMKSEGVYERLWQNLPKGAVTDNFQRTLSVYTALPEQEKLTRMTELLSYGLTDWAVDDRELHLLIEVLDTMSPAGRQAFIQHEGGGWYGRLMGLQLPEDAPPNQAPEAPTWTEQLQSAAETGTDFVKTVAADPQAALDKVKAGGTQLAALLGEGKVDLNYAESVAGGPIGGLDLNEAGDNTIDGDLDTDNGSFDIHIENLVLNSIEHTSGQTHVTTGGGAISGVHGRLKWATPADSASGLELNVDALAMTNIEVTADSLEVSLALITFQALKLAATNPDTSTTPTTPLEAAQLAGQELILLAEDWVPAMSALGTAPGQNPDTISARIAENLPAAMSYEMSLQGALISDLEYREINDDNEMEVVAKVGEAKISGVTVGLEHRESVAVLREEQTALMARKDELGAAEQDRLVFIEAELVALEEIGRRAEELEAMQAAGDALTPAQEDELIHANNRLRTGVVKVEAKVVEVKDAEYDGKSVDHAVVTDLEGQVAGAAVGHNELDSAEQAEADARQLEAESDALDHLLDKAKRPDQMHENDRARDAERTEEAKTRAEAEEAERIAMGLPEPGAMDGMTGSVSLGSAEVTGVETADGTVDHASVKGLEATGAEDAAQLTLKSAEVSGVDGEMKGTSVELTEGKVDGVELHQNGGDVGGDVDSVSATGLTANKNGMDIELDQGDMSGVQFDANKDTKTLRTGSIESASATGASYSDGTTSASVDQISGTGISAADATKQGVGDLTVASGQLQGAHVETGGATIDVGSGSATDMKVTDATKAGVGTAHMGSGAVTDASYSDGSTAVTVKQASGQSLDASGITKAGVDSASIGSGQLTDAHVQSGSMVVDVGAATVTDASADKMTTSGVGSLGISNATATDASYADGGTSASVDGLQVSGVAGQDLSANGTGSVQADHIAAQGIGGASDGAAGTVKTLDVHGAHATADAQGVVAGVDSATATGIEGTYGTDADGSIGSMSVGKSAIATDADYNVVGAQVDGLSMSDIKAHVIPAKMSSTESAGTGETGEGAEATDALHTEALAHASGTFHAWMDVTYGPDALMGALDVTATAHDGKVNMKDIKIRGTGLNGLFGRVALASIKIEPGRGVVAEFGLARIIFADNRDYDGMLSRREGGARKGTILLQPFSESLMNSKVELSEEGRQALLDARPRDLSREDRRTRREEKKEGRQERRADRRADRRERRGKDPVAVPVEEELDTLEQMEQYINVGTAQIDVSGLKMGDGRVGYDSAHATLDRGTDAGANVFEVHTTLGKSASVSSQRIRAKDLNATGPGGELIDASTMGIDGLDIQVLKPLEEDYEVTIGIDGLNVTNIRFGDTSRLPDE